MRGFGEQRQSILGALTDQLPDVECSSVLLFGDADDRLLVEALVRGADQVTRVGTDEDITLQLERRFGLVFVGPRVLADRDDGRRRAVMHAALQHIDRDGMLIVVHLTAQPVLAEQFRSDDLVHLGSYPLPDATLTLFRRGARTTVHDLLFEARATISRVSAGQLHERLQAVDGTVVLDTRTATDRERFGVIPGSVHVPRTVVEWHLDPANGYLHPAMRSFDQPLVLVCNGGYSSSLAAANLVRLGFSNVADLIGGHIAWAAAGLPVTRSDHSHLDTPSFDRLDGGDES
ncbi:MAG: rhodanese-like domain-containing protein [Ilumatobacteraceae bacterium]